MTDTRELSVTRYIDASPAKVWDAMVDRQTEWWCPKPWRAEIDRQERRAEGRRFVSTDAAVIGDDGDFEPAGPMMIGFWEIAPEGTGTRYTARARHWTDEARKQHEEMGFEQGWGACADQLKALCEER